MLLVTSLKRGVLYRVRLDPSESVTLGDAEPMFRSRNRYREIVVSRDGRTLYVATDAEGNGLGRTTPGRPAFDFENPGSILAFTYTCPRQTVRAQRPLDEIAVRQDFGAPGRN